jgi:uncharacterized RDD family membrane protein YckC
MAATPEKPADYPGARLGLPEQGPGSTGGWIRRIVALCVDWLIASLIASSVVSRPVWGGGNDLAIAQLSVFFAMTAVLTAFAGSTIGHRFLGLRVARIAPDKSLVLGPAGIVPGLVRALLICLVIPAVVYDPDQRGLHDRAAGTIVVRR